MNASPVTTHLLLINKVHCSLYIVFRIFGYSGENGISIIIYILIYYYLSILKGRKTLLQKL